MANLLFQRQVNYSFVKYTLTTRSTQVVELICTLSLNRSGSMKILILSRNVELYSTQSLLLAGRRAGHQMRVLDHLYCDLVIDAAKPAIIFNQMPLESFDAVIPRIGGTAMDHGAAVIRQFEGMGVYTTVSSHALVKARDKLVCLQLLAAEGIPVPRTVLPNAMVSNPELYQSLGAHPQVVKLLNSTQGIGVILSDTLKNTETMIETFQKLREKVIVQEFIREVQGSDIRIFIVNGKVVGAMERQALPGEFRSNLHRGATSKKIEVQPEEITLALKAVKILGLEVAGVDLLRSERGPLILEVNASPGLEGIECTTGNNIAAEIIRLVELRTGL